MIYPNVTLRLEDNLPSIELQSANGVARTLAKTERSLDGVLEQTAKLMGASWTKSEIMELVRTGDEYFLEFPEIVFESEAIDFSIIEKTVADALSEYVELPGLTPELAEELKNNWRIDVLASMLDQMYALLIVRTVFLASEVGVGEIQLVDNLHDARLREKMSRDLDSIGVELIAPVPEGVEIELDPEILAALDKDKGPDTDLVEADQNMDLDLGDLDLDIEFEPESETTDANEAE